MTVWIARVSLVMALVLAVAVGVQTWRLQREQGRAVDARAAAQDAELSASGWARIAAGSRAELARIVPALEAEIAALKKSGATFAGSSHWTGHGTAVAAPCTVIMGPPAGDTTADLHPPPPPGQPEAPLTVAVTPHVKIDDAVAIDDAGGIYVARHVAARLSVGESWASEWEPITADPGSTTAVDPEIGQAWRAFKNPPYRLDAFVGASIGSNGLGIVGQLSGGRGRLGWFAGVDYVIADPSASRVGAGGKFTLKQ